MDFERAKQRFEQYLDGYDRENDKVRLKIVHTYGVVSRSREIAERMGLSDEDVRLAEIIALLHDIGRFEQLRRYDSFEPGTMDHARYGARMLFGREDGGEKIRDFVPEKQWDDIICTAIERHSDFELIGISDERTLLHARIIRDADKLDNCRVKLVDDFETFMGVSAEETGKAEITPAVRDAALSGQCILSSERRTPMDYWVSYLVYFYDLNFRVSLDIVEENDFVRKIAGRVPYTNPQTKEAMEEIERSLIRYVHEAKKN